MSPGPTGALTVRDKLAIINRVANPEVRALATGRLIASAFNELPASGGDAALLTALADSLPQSRSREAAQIAIALRAVAANDTASGRARLLALLETYQPDLAAPSFFRDQPGDPPLSILIRLRADAEALTWARSLRDPLPRAAALLAIGGAVLARANVAQMRVFSNGPDMCRDQF